MQLTRQFKLLSLLSLIFFVSVVGCNEAEEPQQLTKEPVVEKTDVIEDTTGIQKEVVIKPDVTSIEQSKTEIDKGFEKMLSLVEKKEQALHEREKKVLEVEKQLGLRADELDTREQRLKFQLYLSWIVFILGVIAIVVAIVIFVKKRSKGTELTQKALEKKKKYLDKMDTQLYQWETEIDELKKKADRAKNDVKQEYLKQIDALNEKKEDAQKKLQDLKAANEEVWADLKKIVDKAWTDMRRSIKSIRFLLTNY
jgi:predicted  nucleic acid-binding Zn-ribbon protein